MRYIKRGLTLLLALCLLFNTCGNSVLAAENGLNQVIMGESDSVDNPDKTAGNLEEMGETEKSEGSDDSYKGTDSSSAVDDTSDADKENDNSYEKDYDNSVQDKEDKAAEDEADSAMKETNDDLQEVTEDLENNQIENDQLEDEIKSEIDDEIKSETEDAAEIEEVEEIDEAHYALELQEYQTIAETLLSAESSEYKLTKEQLFIQCPQYLKYNDVDEYISRCVNYTVEAMDDVSSTEEFWAAFMYGLKNGTEVITKNIASSCGLTSSEYDDFKKDMAGELFKEYVGTESYLNDAASDISKNFEIIDSFYNKLSAKEIEEYKKQLKKACSSLSDNQIDKMTSAIFEQSDKILKYANEVVDLFEIVTSVVALQELELTAIDDLLIALENSNESDLYDGLLMIRNDMTDDIATYVLNNYLTDKAIEYISDMLTDAMKGLVTDATGFAVPSGCIVKMGVKLCVFVYESYKPSVSNIMHTTILYNYYRTLESAVCKYQKIFYKKEGKIEDIAYFEAAFKGELCAIKLMMKYAKGLTSDKRLKNLLDMYRESIGTDVTCDKYIKVCLRDATAAINAGTLEISDSGSVDKTDDGTVIDKNYDSTQSIKAKFQSIQLKYVPNSGQTWKDSWGGATQCFGFARMVFYKLFDANMPSAYRGSKRYEYIDNTNVTLIGQLEGNSVTAGNLKTLLTQGKLGDIIQGYGAPYGQHTMVLVGTTDTGIVTYECNYNGECGIYQKEYTWAGLATRYGTGDSTSGNGISLYHADNYERIYGDGEGLFYDDSINFVISNGVLTKYNGWQKFVSIPDTVTAIGANAFKNNTTMITVDIPDSVTSIGNSAFYGCSALVGVVIPDSVVSVGEYAFYGCRALSAAILSNSMRKINSYCFGNCSIIKSIDISDSITMIDNAAFANCSNLETVIFPDTLTTLGSSYYVVGAFSGCTNLKDVVLPANLTFLGEGTFRNCTSLKEIIIPKKVSGTGYYAGVFSGCTNLATVIFEEGTTEIAKDILSGCSYVKNIIIPYTVTKINDGAFSGCSSMTSIELPANLTFIGNAVFSGWTKLETIDIPDSVTQIGQSFYVTGAFDNCTALKEIILPPRLTFLGEGTFRNCTSLKSIVIPKTVVKTEYYAGIFSGCTNLSSIIFEDGMTAIPEKMLSGCSYVESVEIPNSVTKIGNSAFYGCKKLKEVVLPDSIESIESYAFSGCTSLEEVILPNSIKSMGSYIFSGCTSLKEVGLPNIIGNIVEGTFKDCSSLEKVDFPEKLKTIGRYAFYNCDALTAVTLPDSVTTLGTYIFAESELLSDITLGTGITTIPAYAFNLCPSLKKIVLPYRVTTINNNAFTNCTALTEITIPRSVTSIADSVFSYPSKLTIYGISGTYAETYANNIGATFVNREIKATSVSLNTTELKIAKGVKETLVLSIIPADFTDEVVWKSTDDSIVSVDNNGIINAKSLGTATVKVTVGNLSASCKVTVTQAVTSIRLNKTSLSLEAFESDTLTAVVSPSTAENNAITWSSSDEKVASVDENGLVTAHSKGNAVIKAQAQDGSGIYGSCNVTVINNGYICSNTNELESEHNYPVNSSDFWIYTKEGAEKLYITFDARTDIEADFDYLYIYDAKGKQVGKYTGTQLAGQLIEVEGDTVKIKLVSDDSGTTWGFKVTSVSASGNVENDEYIVTFDSQGGSAVLAIQVSKNTPVEQPEAPIRAGYNFLGWYLNGILYDFSKPVTNNIVLRAKWERIINEPDEGDDEEIPDVDMPENGIIPEGLWIAGVSEQIYTGKALKPDVRVYDGKRRLKAGMDYTVSYKNNIKVNRDFDETSPASSAPVVIVKGKGNYSGTVKAFFKINPVDITNNPSISADDITLPYNGKLQIKEPKVTYNGKKLSAKKDYIVTYPDDGAIIDAYCEIGDYTVTVEGRGNFSGSMNVRLSITDKQLIEKAKTVRIKDKTYDNGNAVTLSESELIVYMKSKNEPLTRNVDYEVSYVNNTEIGTAYALITGIGDYAGVKKVKFKINGLPIKKAQIEGIRNKVYNGEEQKQDITVRLDNVLLSEGTDYIIKYDDNCKKAGTVRMTIQGIGGYTGSIKKSYKITAYDLNTDEHNMISGLTQDLTVKYSSGGSKPDVELKFGAVKLAEGMDYKISYKNNKNIADISSNKAPTAIIKGIGNFKGSVSMKFSIEKKNISDTEDALTLIVADAAYVNKAGNYISAPILRDSYGKNLKSGSDYEVTYMLSDRVTKLTKKDIVPVGTDVCMSITGKGKYEGTINTTYSVKTNNLQKTKVIITPKTYTGGKVYLTKEDITVTLSDGSRLVYGVDYEIVQESYANNTKKGTASVIIKGIGDYGGMKTAKFKIGARRMETFDSVVGKY